MHDGTERRQPGSHFRHLRAAVDELVAVPVARDGEQHRRLELAEAVEHAPRTELWRARRPDRTEARHGEEGDERLRDIREVRDDAVAALHAELLQADAGPRHLLAEVAERQLDRRARLRVRDYRRRAGVLLAADHVLGAVDQRTREPLGAGHLARSEHALVRHVRADFEEVPDRAPEPLEIGDGPAVELLVACEVVSALVPQPLDEAAELEPRAPVGRRRPEDLSLREHDARSLRDENGAAGDIPVAQACEDVVHLLERERLRAQRDSTLPV